MNVRVLGITASLLVAAVAIACGGEGRRSGFGSETDPNMPDGGAMGFGGTSGDGSASSCGINNNGDPEKDYDGDGFSLKDDCNECDPITNKGAHDMPGNGLDEDCSGKPDDEEVECDKGLNISGGDPYDGAKAMGLCKKADPKGKEWGVIEAKWVKPDGSSLTDMEGVGILKKLGVNAPQSGESMLAISSGAARDPGDPGYESPQGHDKSYESGTPAGYPKESKACPGVTTGEAHDGAALEVKIASRPTRSRSRSSRTSSRSSIRTSSAARSTTSTSR